MAELIRLIFLHPVFSSIFAAINWVGLILAIALWGSLRKSDSKEDENKKSQSAGGYQPTATCSGGEVVPPPKSR